jgi:hypothetical protein
MTEEDYERLQNNRDKKSKTQRQGLYDERLRGIYSGTLGRICQFETNQKGDKKMKEEIRDEKNPEFIFCLTDTELLVKAVKGEIDLKALVRKELRNRGLAYDGSWIGFERK